MNHSRLMLLLLALVCGLFAQEQRVVLIEESSADD